jgi:hypothetical protein
MVRERERLTNVRTTAASLGVSAGVIRRALAGAPIREGDALLIATNLTGEHAIARLRRRVRELETRLCKRMGME